MVTLDDVAVAEAVSDEDPVAEAVPDEDPVAETVPDEDPVAEEGAVVDEGATVVCCLG